MHISSLLSGVEATCKNQPGIRPSFLWRGQPFIVNHPMLVVQAQGLAALPPQFTGASQVLRLLDFLPDGFEQTVCRAILNRLDIP